jgi:tripeptidyl-peptidase I
MRSIEAYFGTHNFADHHPRQWMQLDLPASQLEDLLLTDFHIYDHPETGSKDIACDAYHLPKEVREHVDYITPGVRMRKDINKIREKRSQTGFRDHHLGKRGFRPTNTGLAPIGDEPAVPVPNLIPLNTSVCDTYITNDCIRRQYKIPLGSTAAAGNELGIFEDINQHYGQNDLDVFFSTLFPAIPNGTHPIEDLIDGAIGAAQDPSEVGTEANLDFEAAWPLIWPQKTVLFQADDQFYEINQGTVTTPYLGFYNSEFFPFPLRPPSQSAD